MNVKTILVLLVVAFCGSCLSQSLPIISAFTTGDEFSNTPTYFIHFDLNTQTITNQTVPISNGKSIFNVIDSSNPEELTLLYSKQEKKGIYYQIGNFFVNNLTLSRTVELGLETLPIWEVFEPYSYYDPIGNGIYMSGWNGSEVTVARYGVDPSDITFVYTGYVVPNYTAPIGCVGYEENQQITFFFNLNDNDNAYILLTDVVSGVSTPYPIENFSELGFESTTVPFNWPFVVKDTIYLNILEFTSNNNAVYQVSLTDTNTAIMKEILTVPNSLTGGAGAVVTQDQQNIILMGFNDANNQTLIFSIYNIATTNVQTVLVENTLDIGNFQNINAYYTN